ncbi:hypothetical protein H0194_02675 [Corynebacterium incognita]|uniref:Uncharacterized protein n=1 Tax=Corynebacterium incognita TaxID=2754725 RepID=A0A7G7CQT9_9CORY|nr:hypothetical protein [Corynebacterium incognita]QNE89955.1 hypothetical protein H0194_02675 [Corynebacterium incognita]
MDDNSIWEQRYRELERTVEQIMIGLSKSGVAHHGTVDGIVRLLPVHLYGCSGVVCVARGTNLFYGFKFVMPGGDEIAQSSLANFMAMPPEWLKLEVTIRRETAEGEILDRMEVSKSELAEEGSNHVE